VTTGAQTIAGAKTLTSPLNGTTSIFSSAFATNQTSKIGIGFESGYGLINAWGADASTYAGLKFQVSESDGNTYDALRINPDGTLYAPAGGYISILEAASLRVNYAQGFSQALTVPVAKFLNSANNFVKIALGQGETYPNFNDYYGIIALDNNVNLADNKLRFYLGYDDAATPGHSNDQLVIQGDGNVGIGTATPSAKLHVTGTSLITGAATFSSNISINNTGTTIPNIGATSSQGALELYSGATVDYNGGALITLVSSDRSGSYTRGEVYISAGRATNNTANGFIQMSTGNAPRMTITSDGYVGINKTNPGTQFEVVSTAAINNAIKGTAGGSTGYGGLFYGNNGTTYAALGQNGVAGTFLGGNVLIGTATDNGARLQVRGAGTTSATNAFSVSNNTPTELFYIRNDNFINTGTTGAAPYNNSTTGRSMVIEASGGLGYLVSTRESKANIKSIQNIDFLNQLNPVQFNYRKKDNKNNTFTDELYENINYGFIADEVEKVNKELVFYNQDGTLAGVEYNNMIAILTKAIQEQQQQIDKLKNL
jgi:hypothetical protein